MLKYEGELNRRSSPLGGRPGRQAEIPLPFWARPPHAQHYYMSTVRYSTGYFLIEPLSHVSPHSRTLVEGHVSAASLLATHPSCTLLEYFRHASHYPKDHGARDLAWPAATRILLANEHR